MRFIIVNDHAVLIGMDYQLRVEGTLFQEELKLFDFIFIIFVEIFVVFLERGAGLEAELFKIRFLEDLEGKFVPPFDPFHERHAG